MSYRNIVVSLLLEKDASRVPNALKAVASLLREKHNTTLQFKEIEPNLSPDQTFSKIDGSEIVLFHPGCCKGVFPHMPTSVKWMESTWAGLDGVIKQLDEKLVKEFVPTYTLTRADAAFGQSMGEYTVLALVAMERNFKMMYKAQKEKIWGQSELKT